MQFGRSLTIVSSASEINLPGGRVRKSDSARSLIQLMHPIFFEFEIDDVFKSTMHRAVNRSGVERYSIPLFFGTDYDVKLEVRSPPPLLRSYAEKLAQTLPSCVSPERPAKYEVVTAGEYVKSRLQATYGH